MKDTCGTLQETAKKPSTVRNAFTRIKQAGKLPSPSGVALKLMRLVEDDASTIEQIIATVETDPALSARMLQLVNSPLCATSRTIASVATAVKLLGRNTVKNLALGITLIASNRKGAAKTFDYDRFWSRSLARATAARNLADMFECCAPDEAFTLALLARVGKLALAVTFPTAYDQLIEQADSNQSHSLTELERNAFSIDHNDLTAAMLRDWHLADVFCEAVRIHGAGDQAPIEENERSHKIAQLLRLAETMAQVMTKDRVFREDLTEVREIGNKLGLACEALTDRFNAISEEWGKVGPIFAVHTNHIPTLREAHTRASRVLQRVLVVDDDPSIVRLLERCLTSAGYDVLKAGSGAEALQIIHSQGCQLVITDWNMPEMDGLDLCRAIRSSEYVGFVYVIILTGRTDDDSLPMAFEAGADDFVTKPLQKLELLSRLKAGVRAIAADKQVAAQQLAIHRTNAELATLNDKLHQIAMTDELTGLYNRREAMQRLKDQWALAVREGRPLSCIMIDIDHFKKCNDDFGHDIGDAVLKETAEIFRRNARTGETVFRIGGEEFVVLCPGSTAERAAVGAERLRVAVERHRIRHEDETLQVTVSAGVAEKNEQTAKPDDLLKQADTMLYHAKREGRNRVRTCGQIELANPTDIEDDSKDHPSAGPSEKTIPGRVLVVDDDAMSRRLARRLLERDGLEVHEACNGTEALAKVPEIRPHVILMDVEMPRMDGLECSRKLKDDPTSCDIPIIIVSGKSTEKHIHAGIKAGAREYLTKPFRHDEFLLRVRSMMDISRGKQDLQESNGVRGEQARAMSILFDLSRSLAAAENIDAIVTLTTTATADLLSCRRVSVMLPDKTGRALFVAKAIGIDDETAGKILVPVGSAIAGKVFATGKPTVFNSPGEKAVCANTYDSNLFASVPLACQALAVPNKVVGVLNATERYKRQPFAPQDIEYLDLVCNMAASAIEQFQSRRARERAHAAIVIGLAKLAEHRDSNTGRHLERVTQFALLLARELRRSPRYAKTIDARFLEHLKQSMPLHDIGKVSVPDAILLKHGPLTEEEFAAMKQHTIVGANAIQTVIDQAPDAGFLEMAQEIALSHHEWFDGSGYPQGLQRIDIPLSARIAAVADVYDALTTSRPYKSAFPHEKSAEIIRESSGTHFDPDVVDVFLRYQDQFVDLATAYTDRFERSDNDKTSAAATRAVADLIVS